MKTGLVTVLCVVNVFASVGCGRDWRRKGKNDQPPRVEVVPSPTPVALTDDRPVNEAMSDFRGYLALNRIINDRLVDSAEPFQTSYYLNGHHTDNLNGLPSLLGVDVGTGLDSGFRNGKPNAMNMVLYHLLLSGLASDLSSVCISPEEAPLSAIKVSADFRSTLLKMCAWPHASAQEEAVMLELWLAVMKFDAPQAEFLAWRRFFLDQYTEVEGKDAVKDMILAISYNPHFMLKK